MQNPDDKEFEICTLRWMIETFDPSADGTSKACRYCKIAWLILFTVSSAFVFFSFKYELADTYLMLVGAAFSGASITAAGFISRNSVSMKIVAKYVDLKSAKERLNELET